MINGEIDIAVSTSLPLTEQIGIINGTIVEWLAGSNMDTVLMSHAIEDGIRQLHYAKVTPT